MLIIATILIIVYEVLTKRFESKPEGKYHVRKLIKYIIICILTIYMCVGVATIIKEINEYNDMLRNHDYLNELAGQFIFALISGALVGCIIYMYKYFEKISKFIIANIIILIILVVICIADIRIEFTEFNTDLMGRGCTISLVDEEMLSILILAVIVGTTIRITSNFLDKKRLNDLVKRNINNKSIETKKED